MFAYGAWDLFEEMATVWRMVIMTLVWVGAFAAGTQLFWKATDLLAQQRP